MTYPSKDYYDRYRKIPTIGGPYKVGEKNFLDRIGRCFIEYRLKERSEKKKESFAKNWKNKKEIMGPLELVSLELDEYAERIGEYFEGELGIPIRRVKGSTIPILGKNCYSKQGVYEAVDQALGESPARKLVLYGHGRYHHFTYGLCKHADRFSDDYAYVHFDHHHDSFKDGGDLIGCASFIPDILEDTHASNVLYIGSFGPADYLPLGIEEEDLRGSKAKEGFEKLKEMLASLPPEVYMSFDLDVMNGSLISTPFCQGTLTLEELMKCITLIKQSKRIVGADVLGYGGKDEPGKEVYREIVASLMQEKRSK